MSLTYQPFSDLPPVENPKTRGTLRNVGRQERTWSIVGGAAVMLASLAGKGMARIAGLLAGGALIYRGSTGYCPTYKALGINPEGVREHPGVPDHTGHKTVRSIVIQRSRRELYAYWRRLENLAGLMSHVRSVDVIDDRVSHWVVTGPGGTSLEWDAEIINEHENEMIAWQSLPGTQVPNAGTVRFEDAPGGGTLIRVTLEAAAPGGELGVLVAGLFGQSPEQQLEEDLLRFKEQMETRVKHNGR